MGYNFSYSAKSGLIQLSLHIIPFLISKLHKKHGKWNMEVLIFLQHWDWVGLLGTFQSAYYCVPRHHKYLSIGLLDQQSLSYQNYSCDIIKHVYLSHYFYILALSSYYDFFFKITSYLLTISCIVRELNFCVPLKLILYTKVSTHW